MIDKNIRLDLSYVDILVLEGFLSSSGVERSAVNRFVVGSNPTWGVIKQRL